MNIGFFVTGLKFEKPRYSTYWLSLKAIERGHKVWHISSDGVDYRPDGLLMVKAVRVPEKRYRTPKSYFQALIGNEGIVEQIEISMLDVLLLRCDPASDAGGMQWVQTMALQVGRMARDRGVVVLNDPDGLNKAANKLYLNLFPETVRPKSIITRSLEDIREFAKELGEDIIVKPIQGSGGKGVFIIKKNQFDNFRQIIETLAKDGYIITQEFIPEAIVGDTRLFLLNGMPMVIKGRYAAFQRKREGEDIRSNVSIGAKIRKANISDEILELAHAIKPKLIQDGMAFVGLDIVGNKILEINVFCPGGLRNAQRLEGVKFSTMLIEALERKVMYQSFYMNKGNYIDPCVL